MRTQRIRYSWPAPAGSQDTALSLFSIRVRRTMNDEAIQDLARRAGIAVEWQDFAGRPQVVESSVLRRILGTLGLPCATRVDLLVSRKILGRKSNIQALPPLITATAGRPTRLDVGASEARRARLKLETGEERDVSLLPV